MRLKIAGLLALLAAVAPCLAADAWREPKTGMEFVALPKGCFRMGLPARTFENDEGELFARRVGTEMPDHEVCLDAFWMGRYEVRESEWQKVMGDAHSSGQADAPIAGVTWEEASEFARRLSEQSGGARFRLPTEAEWEYACRAGTPALTQLPSRDDLDDKAWFSSPYELNTGARMKGVQPVGRKKANPNGLHDMLGNVWEWVQDGYRADAYARHGLYNPVVAGPEKAHVIRGGGLRTDRRMMRCEARAWLPTEEAQDTVGLRLVRTR